MRASPENEVKELTPEGFNVRSRVHEYGGGDFWVHGDVLYFVNDNDQRIYRQTQTAAPIAITPEPNIEKAIRYADGVVTPQGDKIICVREQHHPDIIENDLIEITVKTGEIRILEQGADFYTSPRLTEDGNTLAFICWHHPQMPWDGTELWIRKNTGEKEKIAGGENESVYQPEFFGDDIYYASDRSGYWNVYKNHENLCEINADIGLPHWVFGTNTYAILDEETIACIITEQGERTLTLINKGKSHRIALPWREFGANIRMRNTKCIFSASSPHEVSQLISYNLDSEKTAIIREHETPIKQAYLSEPEAIHFPTSDDQTAHGFYYPPKNEDILVPENEAPPLIVLSHGGPTANTSLAFNADIQFWTSRGFAVVDVNYRGSTGYGRAYRDALKKQWGIYDVNDCKAAADYLVLKNKANPNALIIKGRSAGGYTTLAALTFTNRFTAGTSYYGISDLELIANDTHKFELHYCDSLVGKYPEEKAVYQARSPIHYPEKLTCPIIFLQGLEDKVVPPVQAEKMIEKLKEKGLAYEYVTFESEGHGFRNAKNLEKALETELEFYKSYIL